MNCVTHEVVIVYPGNSLWTPEQKGLREAFKQLGTKIQDKDGLSIQAKKVETKDDPIVSVNSLIIWVIVHMHSSFQC